MKLPSKLIPPKPSIEENLHQLKAFYPFTAEGKWGVPSKRKGSKGIRIIYSEDQYKAADHFWSILKQGGITSDIPNHGKRVDFLDGSIATYRVITSSKESPTIQYTIKGNKQVKIHFEKKGDR